MNTLALVAAVALTFDDGSMSSWCKFHDTYSLPPAATFFVSRPQLRTADDMSCLARLKGMGHEIGNHTKSHVNALYYVKKFGIARYLRDEVLSIPYFGSFAYPMGEASPELDSAILGTHKFTVTRWSYSGKRGNVAPCGGQRYYSMPLDEKNGYTKDQIIASLRRAKKRGHVAVFHSHSINDEPGDTSASRLIMVKAKAAQLGLRFVTLSDCAGMN